MSDLPLSSTPARDSSSTPIPSDNPIFSDEPFIASSPPSSPSDFPWEKSSTPTLQYSTSTSKPPQAITSAFSVLGKRKALTSLNDNARTTKKPTPATVKKDGKPLTQMQISLGQEVQKKCKACGMEYIASSDEDRKLHDKYHKQNVEGYDVGKDFLSKGREGSVFKTSRKGDDIAAVDGYDNAWRKKRARAALDVVQRELGAVDIPDKQLWSLGSKHIPPNSYLSHHTVYMYIRQSKCVGLLLMEHIAEGKKVLEPAKRPSTGDTPVNAKKTSALEQLRARRAAQQADDNAKPQPIQLATKPSKAMLGISRIWTSPSQRGQGIAKALLDRALLHHNERVEYHNRVCGASVDRSKLDAEFRKTMELLSGDLEHITKEHVAFSQPTDSGAKLARKWSGKKYGWLVYID